MRDGEVPRLHIVTDDAVARLPDLESRARGVARAGPVALHARAPGWDGRALLELARVLRRAVSGTGSVLIVNDRVDVARVVEAHGAHLPAGGLPLADARRLLGPHALIGRSAHSPEEARRAHEEGADYLFLGPIWETASHPGRASLGPEAVAQCGPARVIAIGGVTAARARVCRDRGAYGVAVVSAVWGAADPGGAVREMLLSFGT